MNETPQSPQVRFTQETPTLSSRRKTGYNKTPFRSRRFTPYQKTPKSRTVKGKAAQNRSPAIESSDNVLKEIVNKTWKVYKVSPLFKFSHDSNDIKVYTRHLSAFIEAECHKGVALGVDSETADKATISVVKGLKGLCDAGADAIKITLKKKLTGKKDVDGRIALTALLCSVQHSSDAVSRVNRAFTVLPLMLVKGPVGLTEHLCTWLQTTFDCAVSPVVFTPVQLNWTVALWAGELLDKKSKPVQLQYKPPSDIEGLGSITIDVDSKDCQRLWDSIHDRDSSEVLEEEILSFMKALEAHFYYHFKVSLFAMPLSKVGSAVVYISAGGRLKIFSVKHVGEVLEHLTNLVLEQRMSLL